MCFQAYLFNHLKLVMKYHKRQEEEVYVSEVI